MKFFRNTFIFLCLSVFVNVQAKVIPPNYNFSLDNFNQLMPGSNFGTIQEKFGTGELMSRRNSTNVFRVYVAHARYRFPVMIQVYNNKVIDFVANLPSYFIHDVFHQGLINRHGKQNQYKNIGEQSVYIWDDVDGNKHVYYGACAITCFPVYYAIMTNNPPKIPRYLPILHTMVSMEASSPFRPTQ